MSTSEIIEFVKSFDQPDERFIKYAQEINGLVGPASVALLNGCLNYIDKDKCYLEVGTFQGMSLCGAAQDHPDVRCYGVENFAEEFHDNWNKFDPNQVSNQMILHHNLKKFNPDRNAYVFEEDYRRFFANRTDINGKKVQVYLYDGPHSYEHQVAGLLLAVPLFADHSVVFIDDYKCANVPRSIERVSAMKIGFTEIKHWVDPYQNWREGFVALEYKR